MMEADGKAQNGDQDRFTPSASPQGRPRKLLYLDPLAAVAVGALPPPSGRKRCMMSDHVPYNVGNVATPELYGPP